MNSVISSDASVDDDDNEDDDYDVNMAIIICLDYTIPSFVGAISPRTSETSNEKSL